MHLICIRAFVWLVIVGAFECGLVVSRAGSTERDGEVDLASPLFVLGQTPFGYPARALAFKSANTLVSASYDNVIRSWETSNGKENSQATKLEFAGKLTPRAFCFSTDGGAFAAGSYGYVRVTDLVKGRSCGELNLSEEVTRICFARDRQRIFIGTSTSTVYSYDPMIREVSKHKLPMPWVTAIDTSSDDRLLAVSVESGEVFVMNLLSGKLRSLLGAEGNSITALRFAPKGDTLALGTKEGNVWLCDAPSGRIHWKKENAHCGWVSSLAFSPDGSKLCSASGGVESFLGKSLRLWNVEKGTECTKVFAFHEPVDAITFAPSGDHVAIAGAGSCIRLIDVRTGKDAVPLTGHEASVRCALVSPNGQHLASGSDDGAILLWDVKTKRLVARLVCQAGQVCCLDFSHDNKTLVSGHADGSIILWDMTSNKERKVVKGKRYIGSVYFSDSGKCVAAAHGAGDLLLYDLMIDKIRWNKRVHETSLPCGFCFVSDGEGIFTRGAFGASVWQQDSGSKVKDLNTNLGDSSLISRARQSGRYLMSESKNSSKLLGRFLVWDESGHQSVVYRTEEGFGRLAALSPDGRVIYFGYDQRGKRSISFVEVATGNVFLSIRQVHQNPFEFVAFSPDNRHVFVNVTGYELHCFSLWRAAKGTQRRSETLLVELGDRDPRLGFQAIEDLLSLGISVNVIERDIIQRAERLWKKKKETLIELELNKQISSDAWTGLAEQYELFEPALRKLAKEHDSLEIRARAKSLFKEPSLGVRDNFVLACLRAVCLLEREGSERAHNLLKRLSDLDGTIVSWEAKESLRRLGHAADGPRCWVR